MQKSTLYLFFLLSSIITLTSYCSYKDNTRVVPGAGMTLKKLLKDDKGQYKHEDQKYTRWDQKKGEYVASDLNLIELSKDDFIEMKQVHTYFSTIRVLNLSSNQLKKAFLKLIFSHLGSLESLNLSHNQITEITQEDMDALPKMVKLNVSGNQITTVATKGLMWKEGCEIDLSGNKLSQKEVNKLQLTGLNKLGGYVWGEGRTILGTIPIAAAAYLYNPLATLPVIFTYYKKRGDFSYVPPKVIYHNQKK